jgi:23S rRNA (guanosine2251-2'-O)-methyltransferase
MVGTIPIRRRFVGAAALDAALASGDTVRVVLLRRDAGDAAVAAAARARATGTRVIDVNPPEIARLVGGGATDEVLAFAGPDPAAPLDVAMREDGPAWLLVDVAFPGNVGLAIRTAEVSGAVLAAVAPPLEGEERRGALRASIGADRFFPVFWTDAETVVAAARAAGRRVVALETSGDRAPWDADLTGPVLLVAGGERAGVPRSVLDAAEVVVRLPTAGAIPSYNVQAAMAAVAAERLRQESGRIRKST